MKIGILSKRTTHFAAKMKNFYEDKGFQVKIYTSNNSCIDESLLNNDFYILKSKQLFYLYAGYFLEINNVPVIPDPEISFKNKNRIEAKFLAKKAGFLVPETFLGTVKTIKNQIDDCKYPLILKPIMSSGSRGVKVIKSKGDINEKHKGILFLEKYILGKHFLAYFIGDDLCVCEKKPIVNEHEEVIVTKISYDIKEILIKWKTKYKLLFGHLDLVREDSTKNLYIVDSGSFPEFSNWICEGDPVPKVCNLILEKYQVLKNKTKLSKN